MGIQDPPERLQHSSTQDWRSARVSSASLTPKPNWGVGQSHFVVSVLEMQGSLAAFLPSAL